MATLRQITCINKTDRYNPHERIKSVGGSWGKETQENVIYQIERSLYSYYVSVNGHHVNVIVATRLGVKYIKTENDGDSPDNLLSLPECR